MSTGLDTKIRIQVLDAFSAPLRAMSEQLGGLREKLAKVRDGFAFAANLNQSAEAVGRFAEGIERALRGPADEFGAFEAQMSEVAALTNEIGTDGFAKLSEQAKRLGADTSYSATEAAQAMSEFARAGRNANEILAVTPKSLSLARAAGTGLADTAEILGGAMSGMGLAVSESARAADVLAKTFTSSATTLPSLGESLKMVAPIAKQAGMSLESTAAMIGVLGNASIKGSEAGTGLRAVISRLVNPAGEAEKALSKLGFRGNALKQLQTAIASGDLASALKQLGQATDKLPDAKRLEALSKIFGQEAVSTAAVLIDATMNTGAKGYDELKAKLDASTGTADKLARVMEDNLRGELERTGGAISEVSLKIGERLKPAIMSLAADVQAIAGRVAEWVDKNPELSNTIVRLTAVVGVGAIGLKVLLTSMSVMISTLGALRTAYVATRGAIEITAVAVKGFAAATAAAGLKATAASLAMSAVKWGSAAAGAALLGYGIGRLISNFFGLDEKISNLIAKFTGVDINPERVSKPGLTNEQVYGDGTVIDGKTGRVVKLGTGPASAAPKSVREAREAGAKTAADVNAYLAKRPTSTGPSAGAGAAAGGAGDPATREQTRVLAEGQAAQERLLRELLAEQRRANRGRAGAPAQGGAGER